MAVKNRRKRRNPKARVGWGIGNRPDSTIAAADAAPQREPVKLTPKEEAFVREFLIDLNATQAAKRAGYSAKSARQTGSENLSKPYIQQALSSAMDARRARTNTTADRVLERLWEIVRRCMQEVAIKDHEGKKTGEYRFDGAVANQSLKLIGEHIGMFDDHRDPDDPSRGKEPTVYIIGGQRVEF